jgi:NAD(P)-dependent dehydrogenase (short-subunit alcohol dehydrogenase family)
MIDNDHTRQWLANVIANSERPPDMGNALPVQVLDAEDIAAAVAWLVSDEARYITGVTLPVDAGYVNKR